MSRSVRCSIGTLNAFRSSSDNGTHAGWSNTIARMAMTIAPTTMNARDIGSARRLLVARHGDHHRPRRRAARAVGGRDRDDHPVPAWLAIVTSAGGWPPARP